jgi:hypothetical protein
LLPQSWADELRHIFAENSVPDFALLNETAFLITSESQRNKPFRFQTISRIPSTLKLAVKQGCVESDQVPDTDRGQFANVATNPTCAHVEKRCGLTDS